MASTNPSFKLRVAREEDIPALESLVELSARQLLCRYYSAAQLEVALGPVFGVDRQLIRDGTYFIIEAGADIVAAAAGANDARSMEAIAAAKAKTLS